MRKPRHGLDAIGARAVRALVSMLAALSMTGCTATSGGGSALVSSAAPKRVVMQIINNSCDDDMSEDAEDSAGQVKGLSKVLNGFGIPYDEHADAFAIDPVPVSDDSYEANKERGVGYMGLEAHMPQELAPGEEHSPDHPEASSEPGTTFNNLTTEEEKWGIAMRWEYYKQDNSGHALDGYSAFMGVGKATGKQYVAVHNLVTDKWVICCPYDWGPGRHLPTVGGGKYAGGRIGGVTPQAAEDLGINGGDCQESSMCECWWVENSSQVQCGPVNDLSAFTGGSAGGTTGTGTGTATPAVASNTATAIVTNVLSGTSSSPAGVSIAPADPSSFITIQEKKWQHGSLPSGKVKYIVMHDTESGTNSAENIAHAWGSGYVAAHFIVDKEGRIYSCVPITQIAHHAGQSGQSGSNAKYGITQERDDLKGSEMPTDYAMNAWSIGIEIVHEHNEGAYPNAQLNAVDKLVAYIDQQVGHEPKIIDHKAWSALKQDCSDDFPLAAYQSSRNHNGVMTVDDAKEASEAGGCSDMTEDAEEAVTGIVGVAVSLAGTASPDASIPGAATERPTDPRLDNYIAMHEQYLPGDPYWASCDRGACTAIRASGADADFPPGPCDTLLAYCQSSPKWQEKGQWHLGDSADVLAPGDVLICTGHIKIFVGNEAVTQKFPESDGNMYSASYGDHQPWCYNESHSYDSRVYSIFTCVAPDQEGDVVVSGVVSGSDGTSSSTSSAPEGATLDAESGSSSSSSSSKRTSWKTASSKSASAIGNKASGDVLGLQVAWLCVQMAGTGAAGDGMMSHVRLPDGQAHSYHPDDPRLDNIFAIHEPTLWAHEGNRAVASCTQTACAALAAVVDMDMCPHVGGASGGPDTFIEYVEAHPEFFQEVSVTSLDEMKPGDILANASHTAVYVGEEMAQTKFPGTNCNVYEAGYHSRVYGGLSAYSSPSGYRVWRPVKRNYNAKWEDVDWMQLVDWSSNPPVGSGSGVSGGDDDGGIRVNVSVTRA